VRKIRKRPMWITQSTADNNNLAFTYYVCFIYEVLLTPNRLNKIDYNLQHDITLVGIRRTKCTVSQ